LWPASAAFVTSLVPLNQFARAVTFNSGAFQFSSVIGPTAFGAVIALTPNAVAHSTAWSVYALNALASLACFALVLPIRHAHKAKPAEPFPQKPGRRVPVCVIRAKSFWASSRWICSPCCWAAR
jgi:MFS family permease